MENASAPSSEQPESSPEEGMYNFARNLTVSSVKFMLLTRGWKPGPTMDAQLRDIMEIVEACIDPSTLITSEDIPVETSTD